jgi:hypothetical protein
MIFGVSPTKDAIVIARTTGSGETFAIKTIKSIQFQARSGDDLGELLRRLVVIFDRGGKNRGSTTALLASSSGRFKSSIEAIKGEAITELAAADSGIPMVKVTAVSLKKSLVSPGMKWQARAEERFNPAGRHKSWSQGAAGAAAASYFIRHAHGRACSAGASLSSHPSVRTGREPIRHCPSRQTGSENRGHSGHIVLTRLLRV